MSKSTGFLISLQYVTTNVARSNSLDTSRSGAVTLFARYCQIDNTNHQSVPPTFYIEARYDANSQWRVIDSWQPDRTAPANATITGAAGAGSTTLNFASVPSFWLVGEYAFILHDITSAPTNLTKSEFTRIAKINSSSVDLLDPTSVTHTAVTGESASLFNRAQGWVAQVNTKAFSNLRVSVDGAKCDRKFVAEISYSILDGDI